MPAVVVQSNFNHHWDFFFRKTNSMDHLLLLRLLLLLFWEQVTAQQNNAHINTDVVYLQHQPHLLSFLPYTPVERLFIKDNVEKLLQVYVNRERKMERLGSSVDPLARISNLDAAGMTDSQFHFAILDIFTSLRDLQ